MDILVEGHKYVANNFETPDYGQTIQFIQKEIITEEKYPQYWENGKIPAEGTLHTVSDGTTNEELLVVLINRMQYLQKKFPCKENAIVITNLEESLMWLEKRTADREKRGVEGRNLN